MVVAAKVWIQGKSSERRARRPTKVSSPVASSERYICTLLWVTTLSTVQAPYNCCDPDANVGVQGYFRCQTIHTSPPIRQVWDGTSLPASARSTPPIWCSIRSGPKEWAHRRILQPKMNPGLSMPKPSTINENPGALVA